ncbi:hypothetical protein [Schlesneria sp. T3-172]|uniref:hypothetical protein n=1 Tax=Schlesneria sphaerica TaxID=3373610 RepID=UPI0037C56B8F
MITNPQAKPLMLCPSTAHVANDDFLRLIMLQVLAPLVAREPHEVDLLLSVVNASFNHGGQRKTSCGDPKKGTLMASHHVAPRPNRPEQAVGPPRVAKSRIPREVRCSLKPIFIDALSP